MEMVAERIEAEGRFAKALAARKTGRELIQLFDRLTESVKFDEQDKPMCFGMLVRHAATKVKPDECMQLVSAIRRNDAMTNLRKHFSPDEAELIAAAVVRLVLTSVEQTQDALNNAMQSMEKAKIVIDRGNCLSLACLSGIPMADMDRLCDITALDYVKQTDKEIPIPF